MAEKIFLSRKTIEELLARKRMKQAHLAKAAKVHPATISKAMQGDPTSIETAEEIAKVLGAPLDSILAAPESARVPTDATSLVDAMQMLATMY